MRTSWNNSIRRVLAIIITAGTLVSCAGTPKPEQVARGDYTSIKRYVTTLIQYEMRRQNVTGLSIALVDDQEVVWAAGFGYADKAANIAAAADTVYRVGSISKLFTATAAMQLAEQGRFDIDKPLSNYLPGFSIKSRVAGGPITPRTLMTHHSGLPDGVFKGMWSDRPEPFTRLVDEIKDEYAAYPPNYIFAYSNLGFTLLGDALQNVTGSDFSTQLERTLLRPLGMTQSSFSVFLRSPHGAKAYRDGSEVIEAGLRDVPAGGLDSSVNDLGRFLMMVFADGSFGGHRILKPETLREMLRPQNEAVALDLGFRMGLGWLLSGLGGIHIEGAGPVAHHAGATLHYHSQLIALPRYKLGVVVLSNSSSAGAVVNKVATEALKLALEAKTGIQQPKPEPVDVSTAAMSKEDLEAYAGYYATAFGFAHVTPHGSRLRAEISGKSFNLVSHADGTLGLRYRLLGLFPVKLGALAEFGLSRAKVSGHEILLAQSRGQKLLAGEKIVPAPIPAAWANRAGEYQIVNGDGDAIQVEKIRLGEREGFLTLDISVVTPARGQLTLALAPVSDNEAVVLGLGRGAGETIRAVTVAGVEHFRYSGYLVRRKN